MAEGTAFEESSTPHHRAGGKVHLTAREWLLLAVLAGIQFTHIVDFMIIMPLGPVYIAEMHLTPAEFGFVVAAYTLSAGLAGLFAARFVDRFDRKHALLGLYAGFTAGTLLCAVADNYLQLLAARTVAGAFGGVAAAMVLAVIGDVFHDVRRGTATGIVMSAFSVASIAGVPLGLYLVELFNWHAPFIALGGISAAVLVLAILVLPPLRGHLRAEHEPAVSTWSVVANGNHLRAFALMATLVMSSFLLAPHMATFLVTNAGLQQEELKFIYLCGGLTTLVTLPLFGRLADAFGKLRMFRILALVTLVPIVLVTNLSAGVALPLVLALTTAFMVASSGRMVPAMALITNSSAPASRGGFMSLNAAVQHLASAAAASVSGALLVQRADQTLDGYWLVGLLACAAGGTSLVLAGLLRPAPAATLTPEATHMAAAAEELPAEEGVALASE
jgi:predicted MFS family arabinose efflux permease